MGFYREGTLPSKMKIATFNANSIRVRLEIVLEWLAEHDPDVLALQETKCEDAVFPVAPFEEAGYHVVLHGQKTYNGVALISKIPPTEVRYGLGDPTWPDDKRILAATYDGVRVLNTYVPNGTKVGSEKFQYKLDWLDRMRDEIAGEMRGRDFIWLGDINVAPTSDDVFDSSRMLGGVCHHPEEMARLAKIIELGLTDCFRKFTKGPGHYSYWEFFVRSAFEKNLGWRIDHIYASPSLAERCQRCEIDKKPRSLERPSDHTFVFAEFA